MFIEMKKDARVLNSLSKEHNCLNKSKFNQFDFKNKHVSCPHLDLEHVGIFGQKAQALIGGYDYDSIQKLITHKSFDNLKEFQDSKPSANRDSIKIYSYRTNVRGDLSKYECVWYKLKSPEVIDQNLEIPKKGPVLVPEKILELAFEKARKIAPNVASKVDALGYKFIFESEDMKTGFHWIRSDLTIDLKKNKEVYIKTPTLITNKFVPIFGGMTYCKLFTPKDAVNILLDIANGNLGKI